MRRALCGAAADSASVGLVTGAFWDVRYVLGRAVADYGRPMRGAPVTLTWARNGDATWGVGTPLESRRLTTDAAGHFHDCGLPAGVRLRLQADVGAEGVDASLSNRTQTWWMEVPRQGAVVQPLLRSRSGRFVNPAPSVGGARK